MLRHVLDWRVVGVPADAETAYVKIDPGRYYATTPRLRTVRDDGGWRLDEMVSAKPTPVGACILVPPASAARSRAT